MSASENAPILGRRPRWKKKRYWMPVTVIALLAGFLFANNTTVLAAEPGGRPLVLAHRGMAQTFAMDGVDADTCTASRINPPVHDYLENTIAGIRAAFDAGADQVEFDVHWTADGKFAVFHDWTLDCRTDGTGTTRDHTMDELRKLDIGHGYTADGGKTYPFRGRGIGLMPTLDEVLAAFPTQSLLIHIKSNDPAEGAALADRLAAEQPDRLTIYGGDEPVAAVHERLPGMRVMSKQIMVDCLGRYEALGWTGAVPDACHHTQLHIPEGYARWLWGWPERFAERMADADARIVLVAGSGGFSEGFDTPEALDRIPAGFTGLVWTNRVDTIAPLLR
ncbi:glycerophosphodiester phosphodiesterase [Nocardia beijingensis]|uniref:glycerophosphodiester phosphodiesterase family protein n=1 Tax=Nocardia beijingensis TaxID=95162 RepID=UPI0018952A95|nr:glycerophosphodiester phosphodiesterase family protein [Nocardia beijingensis]MBF6468114.1 glycerophosphodiester phosphodiesterase [Nocardia beijingensis]